MHSCIKQLLDKKKGTKLAELQQNIECLCQLLQTVGSKLDTPDAKVRMWCDTHTYTHARARAHTLSFCVTVSLCTICLCVEGALYVPILTCTVHRNRLCLQPLSPPPPPPPHLTTPVLCCVGWIDKYFERMAGLSALPDLEIRYKFMLQNVIELRGRKVCMCVWCVFVWCVCVWEGMCVWCACVFVWCVVCVSVCT